MTTDVHVLEADFSRADHREAVLLLLNASADETTGNGAASVSPAALSRMVPRLRTQPPFLTLLAFVGQEPAGIAICFCGHSHARDLPLIYVSDFSVLPALRRRGIARCLLEAIERKALTLGCFRMTLEVHATNLPALHLYEGAGFVSAAAPATQPGTVSLVKHLTR